MRKDQAIGYIRSCVGNDRKVSVLYVFDKENLPDVIRLNGLDGFIDVHRDKFEKELLAIKDNEVLTIGRLPLCDLQVDNYEDNLISRVHVIWQKVGDKYLLINCGIYGTTALREVDNGLQQISPQDEPWADFCK